MFRIASETCEIERDGQEHRAKGHNNRKYSYIAFPPEVGIRPDGMLRAVASGLRLYVTELGYLSAEDQIYRTQAKYETETQHNRRLRAERSH
jgi:hypothetical protein